MEERNQKKKLGFHVTADESISEGTSLVGYIEASYPDLVKAFGQPSIDYGEEAYKVQKQWILVTTYGGNVVTIYDWKAKQYGIRVEEVDIWNVGAFNATALAELDLILETTDLRYRVTPACV